MERETPQGGQGRLRGGGIYTPLLRGTPPSPPRTRAPYCQEPPSVRGGSSRVWGAPVMWVCRAGPGVGENKGFLKQYRRNSSLRPRFGGSCRGAGLRIKRVDVWAIFGGIFFPFRPFFPVVTVFLRLYGGVLVLGMLIVKMNKNYANGCKNLQISCQNLRKYCKNALKTCG